MTLYMYSGFSSGGFIEQIFDLCNNNAAEFEKILNLDLLEASQFIALKEKNNIQQWYTNKKIEEFRDLNN